MLSVGTVASSIWFVRSKGWVSRREKVFVQSILSWWKVRGQLYDSIKCFEVEERGLNSTVGDYIEVPNSRFSFFRLQGDMKSDHK